MGRYSLSQWEKHFWKEVSHRDTSFPTTEVSLLRVLMTTEHSLLHCSLRKLKQTHSLCGYTPGYPRLQRKLWVHGDRLQCCLLLDALSTRKTQRIILSICFFFNRYHCRELNGHWMTSLMSTFPSKCLNPHSGSGPRSPVTLGRSAAP